jgi:O-acetyl-ADP-ribose deacetylase (regulator of RNase III)
VNTVNCVGVRSRGFALQFRKAFPENFKVYETACRREEVRPGKMLVFETRRLTGPRFIINFPTKRHWKGKSRLEDIAAGLPALVEEIRNRNNRSVAVPPLGCGLGGLNWNKVRPKIIQALKVLPDVRVLLFEPVGAPDPAEMIKESRVPNMTPGRAVLIELMSRYLAAVMDPFVTLLEIHKLT